MKKNNPLCQPRLRRALAGGLALGLALATVVWFIFVPMWRGFNSDYADSLYWTQVQAESGALFDADFAYACLLPFGGTWLFMPFYALFGLSRATEIGGMIVFVLLFSAALFFFCRSLRWSHGFSAATVAVVLGVLCATEKLRELFFGHIIYYSLGALFWFIGLGLLIRLDALRQSDVPDARRERILVIAAVLWFLLCATNRTQALVTFLVPALAAAFLLLPAAPKKSPLFSSERLRWLSPLALTTLATAAGLAIGFSLTRGLTAEYENAFSGFSASADWAEHARMIAAEWIELVSGHTTVEGMSLLSFAGMINIVRLLAAMLLAVLPALMWFFFPKLARGEKYLLVFHWVLSGLVLFAFVFGFLFNAGWRLSPMVVSAAVTSLAFIRFLWRQYRPRRIAVLLLLGVVLFAGIGLVSSWTLAADSASEEQQIAAFLEEEGVTYGYATFWNADAVPVLTDSRVRVRPIEINENGNIVPYLYNAARRWYEGQGANERYFVLLSEMEFACLNDETRELLGTDMTEWNELVLFRLPADFFTVAEQ